MDCSLTSHLKTIPYFNQGLRFLESFIVVSNREGLSQPVDENDFAKKGAPTFCLLFCCRLMNQNYISELGNHDKDFIKTEMSLIIHSEKQPSNFLVLQFETNPLSK